MLVSSSRKNSYHAPAPLFGFARMNYSPSSSWNAALILVPYRQRSWLLDRRSLTRRIQDRCTHFHVQPIFQTLSRVYGDELHIMRLRPSELAMVREVYLYCGNIPVVFAHSIVARKNLRGVWRGLSRLGHKSLGTILFSDPEVKRTPLEFKKVRSGHFLYDRACAKLSVKPASLWARRSVFSLHGKLVLVTEVFLPEILDLSS